MDNVPFGPRVYCKPIRYGQTQIDCRRGNTLTTEPRSVDLIKLSEGESIACKELGFRTTQAWTSSKLQQKEMAMLHPFVHLTGVEESAVVSMAKDKVARI